VVGAELVPEAEDAMRAGFGGVEVVFGAFEGSKFFKGKVFWKALDREAGKIVGHSIERWGETSGVFIHVWGGAD